VKVDLTDYEKSGTWDVIDGPGEILNVLDENTGRNNSEAHYTIRLRRKTLFYTVNLIIPSVLISCLSMVSFYLPTTAGEKITMSVSILLALVVFLQVKIPVFLHCDSKNQRHFSLITLPNVGRFLNYFTIGFGKEFATKHLPCYERKLLLFFDSQCKFKLWFLCNKMRQNTCCNEIKQSIYFILFQLMVTFWGL